MFLADLIGGTHLEPEMDVATGSPRRAPFPISGNRKVRHRITLRDSRCPGRVPTGVGLRATIAQGIVRENHALALFAMY